jgi:hypothetical protein
MCFDPSRAYFGPMIVDPKSNVGSTSGIHSRKENFLQALCAPVAFVFHKSPCKRAGVV